MGESYILNSNAIDKYSTYAPNFGGTPENISDYDIASIYTTSGANSDATIATLDVLFNDINGNAVNKQLDFIYITGNNFKHWWLEYWNGSAWIEILNETNTTNTLFRTFTLVSCVKIRILIQTTRTPDEEKKMSVVVTGNQKPFLSPIPQDMSSYKIVTRNKSSLIQTADGSIHFSAVRFTPTRREKYGARIVFKNLDSTTYSVLRTLKNLGSTFIWWPESENNQSEIYLVIWVNPFSASYTSTYKGAGWTIDMELQEV